MKEEEKERKNKKRERGEKLRKKKEKETKTKKRKKFSLMSSARTVTREQHDPRSAEGRGISSAGVD